MKLLSFLLIGCLAAAAQTNPASIAARQWRQQHERAIIDEFVTLLSIPNIASGRANIQRNAETIAQMMEKRGIGARPVSVPGSNPRVVCITMGSRSIRRNGRTLRSARAARQADRERRPRDSLTAGGDAVRSGMAALCARAGDDKAPIVAMLAARRRDPRGGAENEIQHQVRVRRRGRAGSANLEKILTANKELFAGDLWLMCDGPLHQTRRQLITFRRARHGETRSHGLRAAVRIAQRPLRELGAQSGDDFGAAADVDEGREWPRA